MTESEQCDKAIATLVAEANPDKAVQMATYHKVPRQYLGVANGRLDLLARDWRRALDPDARVDLARRLWASDIHEARVTAAKLLAQARIRPNDTAAWDLIKGWVPQFDAWAIADHASGAGAKRLVTDPKRLDEVEVWTRSEHMWSRRAALVMTLPWAKLRDPKPVETEARERILGWAADYVEDRDWFIQKSVAWWLRDLSRRDPERTRAFLVAHGSAMKPFARREAGRLLPVDED